MIGRRRRNAIDVYIEKIEKYITTSWEIGKNKAVLKHGAESRIFQKGIPLNKKRKKLIKAYELVEEKLAFEVLECLCNNFEDFKKDVVWVRKEANFPKEAPKEQK